MGISDEAARSRAEIGKIEPKYLADRAASPLIPNIFGEKATAVTGGSGEIGFVDTTEGKPLTEQERRNREARIDSEELDDVRRAELAGVRAGRIEITGAGELEKARRATAKREAAAQDARTLQLLALQAQLAALDAEIADLTREIDDILAEHLSPAELAYLNGIDDPEKRALEEDRIMRAKRDAGEITQEEYDRFKDRWDARAAKMREREQTAERVNKLENEEDAVELVSDAGAATAEAAVTDQGSEKRQLVEAAVDKSDDAGNATKQSDASKYGFLSGGGNALGGGPLSGGTSLASSGGFPGLTQTPPPVKNIFAQAAPTGNEQETQDDSGVKRQPDGFPGGPANGVS